MCPNKLVPTPKRRQHLLPWKLTVFSRWLIGFAWVGNLISVPHNFSSFEMLGMSHIHSMGRIFFCVYSNLHGLETNSKTTWINTGGLFSLHLRCGRKSSKKKLSLWWWAMMVMSPSVKSKKSPEKQIQVGWFRLGGVFPSFLLGMLSTYTSSAKSFWEFLPTKVCHSSTCSS